jgi:hypothetical protein
MLLTIIMPEAIWSDVFLTLFLRLAILSFFAVPLGYVVKKWW